MARRQAKKVIQVPMDAGFLERIDAIAETMAESRAAFIREACRLRLRTAEGSARDRQYVEGYHRKPETASWGQFGAATLARRLPKEKW